MGKAVKLAEKRGANTEMKFVMRVEIAEVQLEAEQAVAKQIVNFVMKDAMRDASIAAKQVAVSTIIVVLTGVIT